MAKEKQTKIVPDGYEEVESANFFKFENIGDSCEGKLIDKGLSEQYKFGLYTLEQEDGTTVRCHGSSQLDELMMTVKIGESVVIEYIDNQKRPKGSMKLFKVFRKKL